MVNLEKLLEYFSNPNCTEEEASQFIDKNFYNSELSVNLLEDLRNIIHESQTTKEQLVSALEYEIDRLKGKRHLTNNHVNINEGIYIN